MTSNCDFKNKLLDNIILNPFPYVDPRTSWKAPMFIDTGNYLDWFKRMIIRAHTQGYCISFVVGDPGAGKTHFLCHLNYLYYEENKFNGVYSIYSAGEEKITSQVLWRNFFSNIDVVNRINNLLKIWEVENYKFSKIGMKELLLSYLNDPNKVLSFNSIQLRDLAIGLSELMNLKNLHICIVIDNIDEYFRWLNNQRKNISITVSIEDISYGVNPNEDDVNTLFSTLRNIATNMQGFLIIVACTQPAYVPMKNVSVDRTLASRITYQDNLLGPLSNSQAYELVNMYMNYWQKEYNVELPIFNECTVSLQNNSILNLYPFTMTSIDEMCYVTGGYARDIKTICSEAIDEMRFKKDLWIVKDYYLANAINEAHKKRPQIVPKEKFDRFITRKSEWMKDTISQKIDDLIKEAQRKYLIITKNKLSEILDDYIRTLNIEITEEVLPVKNTNNRNYWTNTENLRILNFYTTENLGISVLVSYIFSDKPPTILGRSQEITLQNITDAISYIDYEIVSHILFIRHWSNPCSPDTRRHKRARELDPVIEDLSIDEHDYRIIASVEGSQEIFSRSDLVEHVDRFYLNLRTQLLQLIERTSQPLKSWEDRLKEMRRRAAEF